MSLLTYRAETELPEVAAGIERCFGPNTPAARRYGELLATDGIDHGHLGPREADRIWRRHLFNSVAPEALIPAGARVIDLGSGAGLPGIPLALARPDLAMTLLEPMSRRIRFLERCAGELALPGLTVFQGRAPDLPLPKCDVVVARAVAPLATLVKLALPLTTRGGRLIALKGRSVATESDELAGQPDGDGMSLNVAIHRLEDVVGAVTVVAVVSRTEM